jgi:hypothetical protein
VLVRIYSHYILCLVAVLAMIDRGQIVNLFTVELVVWIFFVYRNYLHHHHVLVSNYLFVASAVVQLKFLSLFRTYFSQIASAEPSPTHLIHFLSKYLNVEIRRHLLQESSVLRCHPMPLYLIYRSIR